MTGHAPYLMPDGGNPHKKGKEVQANEVMRLVANIQGHARNGERENDEGNQLDLAEIRALQTVGNRRRRRWLNDRALRDLAGPLTAEDMSALFLPPPFGSIRESPLQQIRENKAAAAIWQSFISIEHHRQEKVLDAWALHNATLKEKKPNIPIQDDAEEQPKVPDSLVDAQLALSDWGRVSHQGRLALRKAHIHSVLQLEMKVTEAVQMDDVSIEVENGFGRLLVHSLAVFHGCNSVSSKDKGSVLIRKSQPNKSQPSHSILCTDVLGCLTELSKGIDSLSPALLQRYMVNQGIGV